MLWSNIRFVSSFFADDYDEPRQYLDLYSASFTRASHHPIDLTFDCYMSESVIASILSEHIHRVRSLTCNVSGPCNFALPAAMLEHLSWYLLPIPIPADLFGGSAPRLRTLRVLQHCIPDICPALSNVTSLELVASWCYDTPPSSLSGIFLLMPRLVELEVQCLGQTTFDCLPRGPAPDTLQRVRLWDEYAECDLVAPILRWQTPTRQFACLELGMSFPLCLGPYMTFLFEGATSLAIDIKHDTIQLVVTTSQRQARNVTLLGADESALIDLSAVLLRYASHLSQVHTLRAPTAVLTDTVLRAMPALTDLTAALPPLMTNIDHYEIIQGVARFLRPQDTLSCPSLLFLRHIVFCTALARIAVRINPQSFNRSSQATAHSVMAAIARYLPPRGGGELEAVEIIVAGFYSELMLDTVVPNVPGYCIQFAGDARSLNLES